MSADSRDRFDFVVRYSKSGIHTRWRLFTFGVQVATGMERTLQKAREAGRVAKEEHRKECSALIGKGISKVSMNPYGGWV